jgi:hypothetical protein
LNNRPGATPQRFRLLEWIPTQDDQVGYCPHADSTQIRAADDLGVHRCGGAKDFEYVVNLAAVAEFEELIVF